MRRIVFALLTLLLLTPCRGASRNPVPKGVLTTVYQNGQVIRIYDRSVTEPVQLKAFSAEIKGKEPKLLFGHIPYYAPGHGVTTVGHPNWGSSTDRGYKPERRERWPAEGFSKTTMDFWQAIFKAARRNHLVASFSGHHHVQQTSIVDCWTQFTVAANCQGGYFEVVIEPMP